MNLPPRIRGRVGAADEGQGHDGKWFFEISMWTFDGEAQIGEPFQIGPWDTEEIAHIEMKKAARIASEACETAATGQTSGKYLDMKNGGVLRSWVEQ